MGGNMNAPGGAYGTGSTPSTPVGGIKPTGTVVTSDMSKCGNGAVDGEEQCDDGNKVGADGCNPLCQIEADWSCPPQGGACTYTAVCGDGKLAMSEACDDGDNLDGNGCNSTCSGVETGWQCRVPGRKCIPFCGDGLIIGTENCDDGNAVSGDGCSVRCQVEPGWSCDPLPCVKAKCGNGVVETGETCDLGPDNGKFHGDGSGCSKTCTKEPLCRDPATGVTQACEAKCGSGNVDPGEECDDGNLVEGDGCSSLCKKEGGFDCPTQENPDTQPCKTTGQCLVLPIMYRDFNSQKEANGHPDFFYMGATVGGQKTLCVPNASGMPDDDWDTSNCANSDSTDLCTGLVKDTLGADGKPAYNDARPGGSVCECRFTDWDSDILSSNSVGENCTVTGDGSSRTRLTQSVKVIQSADSFNQWYHTSALGTEVPGTLELAQVGTTNQYQFSSSGGRTIYDDLHDIFLGRETTIEAGFFPLDEAAGVKECNIWPYWKVAGDTCAAGDAYNVPTQWDPRGSFDQNDPSGDGGPIPGSGTKTTKVLGGEHNFWFTSEVRYLFKYVGGEKLEFFGDDDVWVFINGKLVLDLGAVHERLKGAVQLTDTGATVKITAQNNATGSSINVASPTVGALGLAAGNTYEIAVFHADRHPRESNYQLTLSGFSTTRSVCVPACGDGVATAGEECDDGPNNSPDAYGGCTPECKYGPFCGDGAVNGSEVCDDGAKNGAAYGANACSTACTPAHNCGDGFIDSAFGEQCDMGPLNGTGSCTKECTVVQF